MYALALPTLVLSGIVSCHQKDNILERMKREPFGSTADGMKAELFTLKNKNNLQVQITNYGGIITTLQVPDRRGNFDDIVLGYYTLKEYEERSPHFGCLVGRFGNRIAHGKFTLDGVTYDLAINNGPNHLHGGNVGFDKKIWKAETVEKPGAAGLKLTYVSPDGEENYPGTLTTVATYWLTDGNELQLDFEATTDKKTILNLTHHSYFNLKGHGNGNITDHLVKFNAVKYLPIDETSIPLGPYEEVEGTPFDFRDFKAIGRDINVDDVQITNGSGYDHSFIVDRWDRTLRLATVVKESGSGRVMEVWTTEPAVQFYTGNFLDGSLVGKDKKVYQKRSGFCLEAQHLPDSPNHPEYPSVVLKPGETYKQTTIYKFLTE